MWDETIIRIEKGENSSERKASVEFSISERETMEIVDRITEKSPKERVPVMEAVIDGLD